MDILRYPPIFRILPLYSTYALYPEYYPAIRLYPVYIHIFAICDLLPLYFPILPLYNIRISKIFGREYPAGRPIRNIHSPYLPSPLSVAAYPPYIPYTTSLSNLFALCYISTYPISLFYICLTYYSRHPQFHILSICPTSDTTRLSPHIGIILPFCPRYLIHPIWLSTILSTFRR